MPLYQLEGNARGGFSYFEVVGRIRTAVGEVYQLGDLRWAAQHRVTATQAHRSTSQVFDTRADAIAWLLDWSG